MYDSVSCGNGAIDPKKVIAMEEYIEGREYSCDIALDGRNLTTIRMAKKVPALGMPFGTTLAYVVPARLPEGLDLPGFRRQLRRAARSVGLQRTLAMVDFVVRKDKAFILEVTPRIGGDCLPPLIRCSSGLDMIGLALDFAEGQRPRIPDARHWQPLVGARLLARQRGIIKSLDAGGLMQDARVVECYLKRSPGDRVVLPPEDYDTWVLGHVVFRPTRWHHLEQECSDIASRLNVTLEEEYDQKLAGRHGTSRRAASTADTAA